MRARALLAGLALTSVVLAGCESTQDKAAKLESAQKAREGEAVKPQRTTSIAKPSATVAVVGATLLKGSEGDAVLVTLRNHSASTQRELPILIDVKDANGHSVYQNNTGGLAAGLASVPAVPAHATITWVDDQITADGTPTSVTARVGDGKVVHGAWRWRTYSWSMKAAK
jgi:hypothetical protein